MKLSILLAATAAAALAASTVALDTARASDGPKTRNICLDTGGHQRPATCHGYGGGSRLSGDNGDVCTCPSGAQIVKTPTCGTGETPPAEGLAFEQARLKAINNGSLVGASYEGKPMCVAPANRNY